MTINSIYFILFIAIVCLLYFIVPKKIKWMVLLVASYTFYWICSSKLIVFLLITTLSIYFVTLKLDKIEEKTKQICKEIKEKEKKKKIKNKAKTKKKLILILAIIVNFGILAVLKYSNFIGGNLNSIFQNLHISIEIPLVKFILPLGISYYTLQAIGYVVDVYRGRYSADRNLGRVALFMSFFPQMVEGPIGRYNELANQLYEPHSFDYTNFKFGIQLLLWGYFKKMVIADRAALFVNEVFANYEKFAGFPIFVAIAFYTVQIYTEFSGCIDIVRGTSQMMGINLAQNFKRPFFSKSVQEFWRRWHITLGTWLKDYVFYPVSFSKITIKLTNVSRKIFKNSYITKIIPAAFALFFVWLSNGIWHGASWKYIVYGLYYYVIMLIGMILEPLGNKIIKILKVKKETYGYRLWQMVRTTGFVLIGMLIFRASSLKEAFSMFCNIFTLTNFEMIFNGKLYTIGFKPADFIVVIFTIILLLVIGIRQEKGHSIRKDISNQNLIFRWGVYYAILIAIVVLGIYGPGYKASDFIYGQF